jgi:hypothetical protein
MKVLEQVVEKKKEEKKKEEKIKCIQSMTVLFDKKDKKDQVIRVDIDEKLLTSGLDYLDSY